MSTDETTAKNKWDVALWLDVLTLPGTKHSNEFFTELEQWFLERFKGDHARVMPEWSKGWAYTASDAGGAWTSAAFMSQIRETLTTNRSAGDDWAFEAETLKKYDAHNLYLSPLLGRLFNRL